MEKRKERKKNYGQLIEFWTIQNQLVSNVRWVQLVNYLALNHDEQFL